MTGKECTRKYRDEADETDETGETLVGVEYVERDGVAKADLLLLYAAADKIVRTKEIR